MQSRSAEVLQAELHGSSGAKTRAIRMTTTDPSTAKRRLGMTRPEAAHSVIHHRK
jgi:hypothetical protein